MNTQAFAIDPDVDELALWLELAFDSQAVLLAVPEAPLRLYLLSQALPDLPAGLLREAAEGIARMRVSADGRELVVSRPTV